MNDSDDASPRLGEFLVWRTGRPVAAKARDDREAAYAMAAERVVAQGGEYLVLQVVGVVRAVPEWAPEPMRRPAEGWHPPQFQP